MTLELFAHPFSSFCQKAMIAFYENDIPFTLRLLSPEDVATGAVFSALSPIGKFPLLKDGERTIFESSSIIEYLQAQYPGPVTLIPADAAAAVEVRMMDRMFDNYVSTPQGRCVFDAMRGPGDHDPKGVEEAKAMLDKAYAWLDRRMAGRQWAAGEGFSLADCAAAPALFYADWTHPIPRHLSELHAYRARLLARRSYARAVDEARPYRSYFPLGAPERD